MTDQPEFGLTVRPADKVEIGPKGARLSREKDVDYWCVYLPHQCDSWDVAGDEYDSEGVPRDEAIRQLEAFVAEASEALSALRDGRPFGNTPGAS